MDISFFINISIVLIVLLIVVFVFKGKLSKQFAFPFTLKKSLLTPAEASFFVVLQQVVDEQTLVFPKVRIADVLDMRKGLTPSQRQMGFHHVLSKHVDFVLCNAEDWSIIAVIVLEDVSQRRKHSIQHERLVEGACNAAGLPLYRFKAASSYQAEEIQQKITNHRHQA